MRSATAATCFAHVHRRGVVTALVAIACLAGCSTSAPLQDSAHESAALLHAARNARSSEERAVRYIAAAEAASADLEDERARAVYDSAVGELTVLLSSWKSDWARPRTLATAATSYQLRYTPPLHDSIWPAEYFSRLVPAQDVADKFFRVRNLRPGIGATLVGVRKTDPPEPFAPDVGVTAPVTSALTVRDGVATLTLYDPSERATVVIAGHEHPLAADFTAPLAWYPSTNETWLGLMGALRVSHYMGETRLVMEQPYDPERIPLLFVHGLISTPQMWRNVLNEIELDPVLRGRFQLWVFGYPTGNPAVYSAYRLRLALAEAQRVYGLHRGLVLISHSMGGLLSRMQATTVDRADWEQHVDPEAREILESLPEGSHVHDMLMFEANPQIKRIVFICTPHRGSRMAVGSFGRLAEHLIALPGTLVGEFGDVLGDAFATLTGDPHHVPNSIDSLAPGNPSLTVMDKLPIEAPHHTIAGDRGRGDTPKSSDGVVEYWSSSLESAESEKIVPGPHGSYRLPETIEELRRILHLHLAELDAEAARVPARGAGKASDTKAGSRAASAR